MHGYSFAITHACKALGATKEDLLYATPLEEAELLVHLAECNPRTAAAYQAAINDAQSELNYHADKQARWQASAM